MELPGCPPSSTALRIVHLSDFHLGLPSRGARAVERGVAWARKRDPDLVCITGDLVSRPRGEAKLRELMRELPRCYAILGNHDLAISRDPFSKAVELRGARAGKAPARRRGRSSTCAVCGSGSPGSTRAHVAGSPSCGRTAALTILLSHFPNVLDRPAAEGFDLVLAGHMHDGQICVPYPGGKLRLAHPSARYTHGFYRRDGTVMHVSPGLGTTFVPFRFFARPEATELVLRSAPARSGHV